MRPDVPDTAQAVPAKQFFVSMLVRGVSLADAIPDLFDNCLDEALPLAEGEDADEPGARPIPLPPHKISQRAKGN